MTDYPHDRDDDFRWWEIIFLCLLLPFVDLINWWAHARRR